MNNNKFKSLVFCFAVLIGINGCSESTTESTSKDSAKTTSTSSSADISSQNQVPRVLESFQVGNEVYVRSLAVEQNNDSLWVGTSTGALEIGLTNHEMKNTFTRKDGLANEYIFAIFIDSQGYKWFGTNAGGVSRYRDGQWDVYFPMHGLADYWI